MTLEKILITGATGKQGGAVVRHLMERVGPEVSLRVFVRNPDPPSVRKLSDGGVDVVVGSMDDADSIVAAVNDVTRVFLLTMFNLRSEHPSDETRRGMNFIAAMKQSTTLKQVIFSTLPQGKDYHEAVGKHEVEQALIDSGLPLTTVSPTFYLENFLDVWPPVPSGPDAFGPMEWGWLPSDKPLVMPHIGLVDCGAAVASLLLLPVEESLGKHYTLISDDLDLQEFFDLMSSVVGRRIAYRPISRQELHNVSLLPKDAIKAFEYYGDEYNRRQDDSVGKYRLPGAATIPAAIRQTRQLCGGATTKVQTWLEQHRDQIREVDTIKTALSQALSVAREKSDIR